MSTLLPPAAFSSDTAEKKLLSPSKFTASSSRKPVETATQRTLSPIIESADTLDYSALKQSVLSSPGRSRDNICNKVEVDGEIERLRKENFRLMEENLKRTYECALPKALSLKPLQAVDSNIQRHVDSLISKQAEEINELKDQLLNQRREYDDILLEMKRDVANREDEHQRHLSLLRIQHEQEQRSADDQLEATKNAFTRKEEDLEEKYRKLKDSVLSARESLDECNSEKQNMFELTKSLQSQLKAMQESCDTKERIVQQLRTQLSTYQQRDGEKERWPQERKQLESKLYATSSECETLRSENELLLLRISSINDILTAQQDSLRSGDTDSCEQDKLHSLLNSWRYRVYQLLVQQKSKELVDRKEAADSRQQLETMKTQLQSLQSRARELSSTVTERDGQISILSQHKQKLELSVVGLQEKITEYRVKEEAEEERCGQAMGAVRQLYIQFESQVNALQNIEERVKQQDSRVISACKQLRRCHATVGEKFEVLNCKLTQKVDESDDLSGQLYEKVGECDELAKKLASSDMVKQDIQRRYAELQQCLLTQTQLVEEKEETINKLRDESNKLTNHMDLERKSIESEIKAQYKDRIIHYECDISALKKDLAKTVVALRQAERRQANIHTSHTRELDDVTSHTNNRIQSLESELAGVQVERNLLHSNLAALGSTKHRRLPRVTRSLGTSPQTSPYKSNTVNHSLASSMSSTSDDKISILGSVTQLAANILNSESDTDDADEAYDNTPTFLSTNQM